MKYICFNERTACWELWDAHGLISIRTTVQEVIALLPAENRC